MRIQNAAATLAICVRNRCFKLRLVGQPGRLIVSPVLTNAIGSSRAHFRCRHVWSIAAKSAVAYFATICLTIGQPIPLPMCCLSGRSRRHAFGNTHTYIKIQTKPDLLNVEILGAIYISDRHRRHLKLHSHDYFCSLILRCVQLTLPLLPTCQPSYPQGRTPVTASLDNGQPELKGKEVNMCGVPSHVISRFTASR